jgi:hypothetical protein
MTVGAVSHPEWAPLDQEVDRKRVLTWDNVARPVRFELTAGGLEG